MWQAGQVPVPGYKLEKFIGKGNFGEVWQSTSPGGTKCALKFLNLRERQGRKEFRAIQRLKQIRHANLMPINAMWLLDDQQQVIPDDHIDSSHPLMEETRRQTLVSLPHIPEEEKPRTLVMAMPLAESNLLELLHQRQQQGKDIPVEELLVYMMDAARALDYLNAQCHEYAGEIVSVQHGDVKPENLVLLGGSVMLCDFGVARTLGAGADTRGTSLGGSLAYMAPECMAGQASPHSDQFSLAISYAELRTGNLPFAEESITQVIEDRRKGQLDLTGLLPAEQRILRRACAVNPEKRFKSNAELIEALRSAVLDGPPRAAKPGWLAAAAVAAVLISLASVASIFWQPEETERSPDPPPVKSAREFFAEAMQIVREPGISPSRLSDAIALYSAALEAGFPAETPDPRRLGIQDDPASEIYPVGVAPCISELVAAHPGSGRILAVGQDGRSLAEPISLTETKTFELGLPSPIASVQWLDDSRVLIRDCATTLWRVELPSGDKEELASGILRMATSTQGKVGLAAGDSPSGLYRVGSNDVFQVPYPNIFTPRIAIDAPAEWGIVLEEFEPQGKASVLRLDQLSDAATPPMVEVTTHIEPYCVTCLRIGEHSFAVVGGKSQLHPLGLALIPLPVASSNGVADANAVVHPTLTADQDVFQGMRRAVRSMATHASQDQAWGRLAAGHDIATGNATTELWKVLADGTMLLEGFIGQATQAESISALAFDPSGEWLARGTSLGEVRLTKLATPELDFELTTEDYEAEVLQLQIIAGQLVATFDDASILIWDFDECRMVFDACQQQDKPLPRPVATRPQAG